MAAPTILVCSCGMRLKAAGAVPGRVGKCPACGGLLRVPDDPTAPKAAVPPDESENAAGAYAVAAARPSAYSPTRGRPPVEPASSGETAIWDGFVRAPEKPETSLLVSLRYPLWGANGIALLVFLTPLLWFTSYPWLRALKAPSSGGNLIAFLLNLLSLLPMTIGFLLVGGYALLFLARMLASSAIGEPHHPRWPEWDLGEMFRGLGRWIWAIVIGGIVGGFPATAYWLYCGDIDLFDRIILVELCALGAVYAQMALLATILHDDLLAANPITVFGAIRKVRWKCLRPALVIGAAIVLGSTVLMAIAEVSNQLVEAVAFFAFWLGALYGTMVVLRVLGLFYHRNARVLGWFRDRPRWGV